MSTNRRTLLLSSGQLRDFQSVVDLKAQGPGFNGLELRDVFKHDIMRIL